MRVLQHYNKSGLVHYYLGTEWNYLYCGDPHDPDEHALFDYTYTQAKVEPREIEYTLDPTPIQTVRQAPNLILALVDPSDPRDPYEQCLAAAPIPKPR